jgi:alpha-glucosidase
MKISSVIVILSVTLVFPFITRSQPGPAILRSPDGQLSILFEVIASSNAPAADTGRLVYSVSFHEKRVLERSGLRLDLDGQEPLGTNIQIVATTNGSNDSSYQLVTGKTREARDHFNALRVDTEDSNGRKFAVEARAYDDAVAFRYVVPEQPALQTFRLTNEKTEFRLSKDAMTYALVLPNFRSMYESEFVPLAASAFANQGGIASTVLIGCPLVIDIPGVAWMAITEADLRDYSSMYLENLSASWTGHRFQSVLAPKLDDTNVCVAGTLPHHSAWRVLMVADDPGRLVESTVLTSLNPPSAIADTSWIRAGKASWNWWSDSIGPDGQSGFDTDTMKYYVDFAAKSGFEYMLVDAGWSARTNIAEMNGRVDIPELVHYAGTKNVKVWIWLHHDAVARQMDEAFPIYERWGVAGLKIDFVERDDQTGMDWYYRVAELAAKHHLMVDFHGSTKPSGLERTWPNVLGYEGVAGMEQSKAGARDNPDHHVTLPFTRMVAGPMDYTPGAFDNATRDGFIARMNHPMVMGTRAHQLAMYVVYQAAFQMVSDWPGAYEGQPEFQFIKDVPATWDESRVLNGRPGESITMARRRGDEWFLGSMTGWQPRELEVPLSFLGNSRYVAEIYADAADAGAQPKHVAMEKKKVNRNSRLKIRMAAGGGCAVRFVPMK